MNIMDKMLEKGCKIKVYKNPSSGKFRWQITSGEEFEDGHEAAENISSYLMIPEKKEHLKWVWDTLMKRWKCPVCGGFFMKSGKHCVECGTKLEKGE